MKSNIINRHGRRLGMLLSAAALLLSPGCTKEEKTEGPGAPTLALNPETEEVTFTYKARERFDFKVETNQESWDVSIDGDWCYWFPNEDGTGFALVAQRNMDENTEPEATITVTAGDAAPISFKATQEKYLAPYLTLVPDVSSVEFTAAATESYTFEIDTNDDFGAELTTTVSAPEGWYTLEMNEDNTGFTLTATTNEYEFVPGTVNIKITSHEGDIVKTLAVSQKAKEIGDFEGYRIGSYWPDPKAVYENGELKSGQAAEGVVFWLDTTHPSYNPETQSGAVGKIVSIDGGGGDGAWSGLAWCDSSQSKIEQEDVVSGMDNQQDGSEGTANMIAHYSTSANFATLYPAFNWIYEKNGSQPGEWYMPAVNELREIYTGVSGMEWSSEISAPAWAAHTTFFNDKVVAAGGTAVGDKSMWSINLSNISGDWHWMYILSMIRGGSIQTDMNSSSFAKEVRPIRKFGQAN